MNRSTISKPENATNQERAIPRNKRQANRPTVWNPKKKKSPSLRTNRARMGSINLEKSKAVLARKIFRPTETSEGGSFNVGRKCGFHSIPTGFPKK